jgi:hypothetical protein
LRERGRERERGKDRREGKKRGREKEGEGKRACEHGEHVARHAPRIASFGNRLLAGCPQNVSRGGRRGKERERGKDRREGR